MIPLFFSKSAYGKRRHHLSKHLTAGQDILVFFNAPEAVRSHDTHYLYRPDSNFVYFTGFAEPGSAFLLYKTKDEKGKEQQRFEFFCRPKDPEREQWDGLRYGVGGAKKHVGADSGYDISILGTRLLKVLSSELKKGVAPRILTNANAFLENKIRLDDVLSRYQPNGRRGQRNVEAVVDIRETAQAYRLIKDADELKVMRESSKINVEAHRELMHRVRPGMWEYNVREIVESYYYGRGCDSVAYNSICAGGANATILHYNDNCEQLKAGDLLLVDAGCEHKFYASDITRTIPVSGIYTRAQRNIMDVVLEAHQETIAKVKVGLPFARLNEIADEVLVEGLKSLKLLKGTVKENIKNRKFKRYYPHNTSHWLGMDVHDPCPYMEADGSSKKLQKGVVFTVEPGLYFLPDDKTVPQEYRGIGVRIEDDVYINSSGRPELLTAELPRSAIEIEREMAKRY